MRVISSRYTMAIADTLRLNQDRMDFGSWGALQKSWNTIYQMNMRLRSLSSWYMIWIGTGPSSPKIFRSML